jgi:hypothetical protein
MRILTGSDRSVVDGRLTNGERSRGGVFGEPRRESMIGINQLRWSSAPPRIAQPHR